jgi:hypothetical protein
MIIEVLVLYLRLNIIDARDPAKARTIETKINDIMLPNKDL